MKKLNLLLIGLFTMAFVACGGEEGDDKEGNDQAKSQEGTASSGIQCEEENKIEVVSGELDLSAENFDKVIAFKSGWNYSSKSRPNLKVNFANYDAELSRFDIKTPEEEGNYIVQITFNGIETPKDEPLKEIESGEYKAGSSMQGETSISVAVWQPGGKATRDFTNMMKFEGSGTITAINDKMVCGTVSVTDGEASVNASFSAPIEKDFFESER